MTEFGVMERLNQHNRTLIKIVFDILFYFDYSHHKKRDAMVEQMHAVEVIVVHVFTWMEV